MKNAIVKKDIRSPGFFKINGSKTGKTSETYFSQLNYDSDGVYIDPYRLKLKEQLDYNKKIIHEKPFLVINSRKVE